MGSFPMRSILRAAVLAAALTLPSTFASAQEMPALVEYGKLPDVEQVSLSPSGKRIAVLTSIGGKRVLVAIEGKDNVLQSLTVGDMKVRYIEWIGEDRLMLVSSQTEDLGYNFTTDKAEFYIGRVLPVSAGLEAGLVFAKQRGLIDAIVGDYGMRKIDGRWFGFYGAIQLKRGTATKQYEFDHGRPFLYRIDLQDFSVKKIANAARPRYDNDWLIDANGEVAATFDIHDETGEWTLRNSQGDRIAKGRNPTARVGLVGLGQDGTTAIVAERGIEKTEWFEVPLTGGEKRPFLEGVGFERLYFDEATGHLAGYLQRGPAPVPVFFDKKTETRAVNVRKAFGDLQVRMADWTQSMDTVLVQTSGNGDSGTVYRVDVAGGRADPIAYERRQIEPYHVGRISTFAYTASDGTQMDGILTLPPKREPKDLPVVMLPHGGPHSHDTPSFYWFAQAFASRGYAVFQPNFRGSTNRSDSFRRAGYGEWGRKMQTDKSDGLAALAEAGIVDPERACIVGASYGGYAALAGVTLQQGIYRCAVAVAPVSDIKDMYQEDYRASGDDRTTKVALLEQLGPRDGWDEVSPLRAAERADAPIMLIHGKDDIVVPYSHSAKMADKLDDHDKPFELIALDGEDHWLSLSKTRQLMLEQAVRFVEEHNPPK